MASLYLINKYLVVLYARIQWPQPRHFPLPAPGYRSKTNALLLIAEKTYLPFLHRELAQHMLQPAKQIQILPHRPRSIGVFSSLNGPLSVTPFGRFILFCSALWTTPKKYPHTACCPYSGYIPTYIPASRHLLSHLLSVRWAFLTMPPRSSAASRTTRDGTIRPRTTSDAARTRPVVIGHGPGPVQ